VRHFLPNSADLALLETPAGLAVLSCEQLVANGTSSFVHSRFSDAIGLRTYEVRKAGNEAYVAVTASNGDHYASQPYATLDHARAAAVQALICSTQDALQQIVNFIPEEALGIQAVEEA
jgi:hypothetical protein